MCVWLLTIWLEYKKIDTDTWHSNFSYFVLDIFRTCSDSVWQWWRRWQMPCYCIQHVVLCIRSKWDEWLWKIKIILHTIKIIINSARIQIISMPTSWQSHAKNMNGERVREREKTEEKIHTTFRILSCWMHADIIDSYRHFFHFIVSFFLSFGMIRISFVIIKMMSPLTRATACQLSHFWFGTKKKSTSIRVCRENSVTRRVFLSRLIIVWRARCRRPSAKQPFNDFYPKNSGSSACRHTAHDLQRQSYFTNIIWIILIESLFKWHKHIFKLHLIDIRLSVWAHVCASILLNFASCEFHICTRSTRSLSTYLCVYFPLPCLCATIGTNALAVYISALPFRAIFTLQIVW